MKRTYLKKISEKGKIKRKEDVQKTEQLHKFFRDTWDQQEDDQGFCYCYQSGQELPGWLFRSNSACYHHLLPKSLYPQFEKEAWNIVILHPDVHAKVEQSLDNCPKVKELTLKMMEEYGGAT